jgi:peptidoglycan hydrolase-like protein with peptidoglycan-binding domain
MGYYSGTIQKGSTGNDVKKWQEFLQSQGYDLSAHGGVDGIFGDKTDEYTRAYQRANGLGEDGIVGALTWERANFTNVNTPVSAPTASTPTAAPTLDPMPTAPTYDTSSWDESDKGQAALGAYNDAMDAVNNYGDFTYAKQAQYNDVINRILNREDFTYDFNGDALYQQYKDKYIQQGKMAMGDAIGQASAMTGGYGNSYAQSVGQQAYQGQLNNLNDVIPELYQMALDRYNAEGQDLYNQFGMLGADRDRAYGEYQDGYNKLMDMLGIKRSDYYDGGDMFYTEQNNRNTVAGRQFDDAMRIWENNSDNAWKTAEWNESNRRYDDEQAWKTAEWNESNRRYDDEQAWKEAEWEEDQRRWEIEDGREEEKHDATYGNSSSDAPPSSPGGNDDTVTEDDDPPPQFDKGGYSDDIVKKAQEFIGVSADGKWGPDSSSTAKEKGYDSIADVVRAMGGGGGGESADDYAGWDYGDWEGYFATIRNTEGKSAAEAELNRMLKAGYIPQKFVSAASIGSRGSLGH